MESPVEAIGLHLLKTDPPSFIRILKSDGLDREAAHVLLDLASRKYPISIELIDALEARMYEQDIGVAHAAVHSLGVVMSRRSNTPETLARIKRALEFAIFRTTPEMRGAPAKALQFDMISTLEFGVAFVNDFGPSELH